ncbi:hypothetical protein psal_cds_864 [Pandoravirus salinus]|uniref:Uncharacterized protein n=1 Tax=Pandoravirus salinus TaxID=1349410 RepID=S4VX27_9VIRU|nr:hypothetical protein psal_cds_864 [Pandoravirus salinus]AGO84928.1 hypothetical protein psal_cds_864 [Pandoravirus salinus]
MNRRDDLRVLSVALAAAARTAEAQDDDRNQDGHALRRHSDTMATSAGVLDMRDHFAGPLSVCVDWRQEVQRRGLGCDPHGVRLCIAVIDALGATVHGLDTIPPGTARDDMRGVPENCDEGIHVGRADGFESWTLEFDDGDSDDTENYVDDNDDVSDIEIDIDDVDDHGDENARGDGRNQRDGGHDRTDTIDRGIALHGDTPPEKDCADAAASGACGSQCESTKPPPPPDHLLLSCSRTVRRDDAKGTDGRSKEDNCHSDSRPANEMTKATTEARFLFKVRVGFCPDVWATVGPLIDADTGACIRLDCLLVARDRPAEWVDDRAPRADRQRLLDFFASGQSTWAAFAAGRYSAVRRLPQALAMRGWRVKGVDGQWWSWNPSEEPTHESDTRALRLSHPGVPAIMRLHFGGDCLTVSVDPYSYTHYDAASLGAPGVFAACHSNDSVFYRDAAGFPSDPCTRARHGDHWSLHIRAEMALQRARLVGAGLVSPCVLTGRSERYASRQWDRHEDQDPFSFINVAARTLPCASPEAMADLVDAYVAQALFGEYGPVDPASGRHLNGGLCDDLLDAAVASGRLCRGLCYIRGLDARAHECPIDCDLTTADVSAPRMLVNWRARCTPLDSQAAPRHTIGRSPRRLGIHVWMAIAVQTDGRGGACIGLVVPHKGLVEKDRRADEPPTGNDALWRAAAARCAKGAADRPADLHPALVASLEMERACGLAACMVPWAYHTGADGPVDARLLADWALDRTANLLKAMDDAVPHVGDIAEPRA